MLGSDQLRDIYFLSGTTGYLISRDGYVYKTSDSGLSWAQLNSSSIGAGGQTLVFLNENNGIAVMNKSIFRTDDGGENWTQVFESTHELKAISFLDENIGVVCGSYSQVLRTSDGGITWVADIVDQTNGIVSFEAIQLLSPDLGYASGHAGKILKFH